MKQVQTHNKADTDLLYYIQVIKKRIYTIWNIPANIQNLNELPIVKTKIKLLKSGKLTEISFETSSHNNSFDRSI
ncbi:TonB C-terminal domain-containing protein, partial [bacterium]|nr:TonB C-terminal domain-containing protein [bacterium]